MNRSLSDIFISTGVLCCSTYFDDLFLLGVLVPVYRDASLIIIDISVLFQVSLGDYALPPDKRMEHLQGIPRCGSSEYTDPYESSKVFKGTHI